MENLNGSPHPVTEIKFERITGLGVGRHWNIFHEQRPYAALFERIAHVLQNSLSRGNRPSTGCSWTFKVQPGQHLNLFRGFLRQTTFHWRELNHIRERILQPSQKYAALSRFAELTTNLALD